MNNQKLLALADHIEGREDFNQDLPDKCVIRMGLELVGAERHPRSDDTDLFAEHYGLTEKRTDDLYWGQYNNLFTNELNHSVYELHRVSRFEAARILRRLATE